MKTFEKLFGTTESKIKETCLILPLAGKDVLNCLGIKKISKGMLYSTGNTSAFTTIHTGVGPALLGDAVLYLADTHCKNIVLFGSCGLVMEDEGLKIGSLVVPLKSYSLEGFSDMLLKDRITWKAFYPDSALMEKFLAADEKRSLKKAACATIGSLKLEEEYVGIFKEKNVQIVDMECAALFSASMHVNKKATALFYVTDIINKKPFYINLDGKDRHNLNISKWLAADIICKFIEKNLSG